MKNSRKFLHTMFIGLIALNIIISIFLIYKFNHQSDLLNSIGAAGAILCAAIAIVYKLTLNTFQQVEKNNSNGLVHYRVLKIIFRKHIHDVANKIQILLNQSMVAKKENISPELLIETLNKSKVVVQELIENIKFIRKQYLVKNSNTFEVKPEKAEMIFSRITVPFAKRLNLRKLNAKASYQNNDISVAIDHETFYKFVTSNLFGYIIENCLEGSTIEINFNNEQKDFTEIAFKFNAGSNDVIKNIQSGVLSSDDDENEFFVANDFVTILGGKLSVIQNNSDNSIAISILLPAAESITEVDTVDKMAEVVN